MSEVKYKKGWIVNRVKEAAKEYDSWPDSIKKALKLNTAGENV